MSSRCSKKKLKKQNWTNPTARSCVLSKYANSHTLSESRAPIQLIECRILRHTGCPSSLSLDPFNSRGSRLSSRRHAWTIHPVQSSQRFLQVLDSTILPVVRNQPKRYHVRRNSDRWSLRSISHPTTHHDIQERNRRTRGRTRECRDWCI